jgi:hypothetical protein
MTDDKDPRDAAGDLNSTGAYEMCFVMRNGVASVVMRA